LISIWWIFRFDDHRSRGRRVNVDDLQLIEINAGREFSKVKSRVDGITAMIAIWYNGSRCNKTRAYLTAPQNETSTDNCHGERAVRACIPQYLPAYPRERICRISYRENEPLSPLSILNSFCGDDLSFIR